MSTQGLTELADGIAGCVAEGPGDTVLWIHGYTLDSSSWEELWRRLPGWRHVGIDMPGHGNSRPMMAGEDLPAMARRIGRLALDQGARHVVALSFGATLALQVAIEFPEAFATLILGSPALGGGPQEAEVGVRYEELKLLYETAGAGRHMRELWMTSPPNIFKGAEHNPPLWEKLCDIVGRHTWAELRDSHMRVLGTHAQREEELRRIGAASLVLVGDNEMHAFKRCAELIRRAIPNCRRVYLPDAWHLCMLEEPERASAIIESHLRGEGARPSLPASGVVRASEGEGRE